MTGYLTTLRDRMADHLGTRGDLGGVSVVTRKRGDIEAQIEEAISKLGAFIFVPTPLPVETNPNVPDLWWNRIEITILVGQSPTLSALDLDACLLAERVILHLKAWRPLDLPGCDLIYPAQRCIEEYIDPKVPGLDLYQVNLLTKGGIVAMNPSPQTP
jgi:hypothetical protein